jgi:hypothetical protein
MVSIGWHLVGKIAQFSGNVEHFSPHGFLWEWPEDLSMFDVFPSPLPENARENQKCPRPFRSMLMRCGHREGIAGHLEELLRKTRLLAIELTRRVTREFICPQRDIKIWSLVGLEIL